MGKPVFGTPIWSVSQASVTYQIDAVIVVTATDPNTNAQTKQTTTCKGSMVYNVTGGVYPDVTSVVPKN